MANPGDQAVTGIGTMMPAAAGITGPREERSTAAEQMAKTIRAAEGTGTIGIDKPVVKDQRKVNTAGMITRRLVTAQRRAMTDAIIGNGTMPCKGIGTEAGMLGWMRGVASAPAHMMSPRAGMLREARSNSTRSTSTMTKQAISQSTSTSTGKETREETVADLCDVWMLLLPSYPWTMRNHLRKMLCLQLCCRCSTHMCRRFPRGMVICTEMSRIIRLQGSSTKHWQHSSKFLQPTQLPTLQVLVNMSLPRMFCRKSACLQALQHELRTDALQQAGTSLAHYLGSNVSARGLWMHVHVRRILHLQAQHHGHAEAGCVHQSTYSDP